MSNLRAAKAAAVSAYLTGDLEAGTKYYDVQTGSIVDSATAATKGKGTANDPGTYKGTDNEYGYTSSTDYSTQDITIAYTKGCGGGTDTLKVSIGTATSNTKNLADSSTTGTASGGTASGD